MKDLNTRRNFLKQITFGTAASIFLNSTFANTTNESRPNFILIMGDDISIDDFGCYGHPHIRTPNVDKLADNGMRFTNAYLTTSQCSPTRCSVITGRYPHNTGAPELHNLVAAHFNELSYKDLFTLRDQAKLTSAQADIFASPRPPEALFDTDDVSPMKVNDQPLVLFLRTARPALGGEY